MSTTLLHLSDCHLGALSAQRDPLSALEQTIQVVLDQRVDPDAVIVSGDLSENGRESDYALVAEVVGRLGVDVICSAGNHDDRDALRRSFSLPGEGGDPILYACIVSQLRLVVLDTQRLGEDGGSLGPERLSWLEACLKADARRPTVIVMHHPPVAGGTPAWERISLDADDRAALDLLLRRFPHVLRILCGHLHRAVLGTSGGRPVFVAPSTHRQAVSCFAADEPIAFSSSAPPAFAVHVLSGGAMTSHVHFVA